MYILLTNFLQFLRHFTHNTARLKPLTREHTTHLVKFGLNKTHIVVVHVLDLSQTQVLKIIRARCHFMTLPLELCIFYLITIYIQILWEMAEKMAENSKEVRHYVSCFFSLTFLYLTPFLVNNYIIGSSDQKNI